jgi:asparagine synthase (glutamine-hydrolysing)
VPSFAYSSSPEGISCGLELPSNAHPIWDDTPGLLAWGKLAEHTLLTAIHPLGRIAILGNCFTNQAELDTTLANALEADRPELLTHLPGSYSALLIEENRFTVLCDVAGVTPIYFGESRNGVVVSSLPSIISGKGQLRPNPAYIAAHMVMPTANALPDNYTCFVGISRIRGGQMLRVADGQAKLENYEPPEPDRSLTLESGASALRTALQEAIRARKNSGIDIRANLSGGKDSSSVVALALQELGEDEILPVYFMDNPDLPGGDRDYVNCYQASEPRRLNVHWLDARSTSVMRDPTAIQQPEDVVHAMPPHRLQVLKTLYKPTSEQGPALHLTGNGGDEVLDIGIGHMPDLFKNGQLLKFLQEGLAWARVYNGHPTIIWRDAALLAMRGPRGALRRTAATVDSDNNFDPFNVINRGFNPFAARPVAVSFLTREIRQQVAALTYRRAEANSSNARLSTGNFLAWMQVRGSANTLATEESQFSDAAFTLQSPLLDNNVVRAALAIDARVKGDARSFKLILEKALAGILPSFILERKTKGIYDPHNAQLHIQSLESLDWLLDDSRLARMGIIEPERVRRLLPLLASLPLATIWALEQVQTAELWLRSLERAGHTLPQNVHNVSKTSMATKANRTVEADQTYVVPSHIYAIASPTGTLNLFNSKTTTLHPLNITQSHILRAIGRTGNTREATRLVTAIYPSIDKRKIAADFLVTLHEFAQLGIVSEAKGPAQRELPIDPKPARFISSESKVAQAKGEESRPLKQRLAATAAVLGSVVIQRLAPGRRREILAFLQRKIATQDATYAQAENTLSVIQRTTTLGRLACLEASYAAALALAFQRRRVDWHIGGGFYPAAYHAWIEAAGRPVRTRNEGTVAGVHQSFFK